MDLQQLEAEFVKASEHYDAMRRNLQTHADIVIDAREALEAQRAQAILENKFDGKNAETREAQAREYFHVAYDELGVYEQDERTSKMYLDLAQNRLDLLRYRLRIAELMSK